MPGPGLGSPSCASFILGSKALSLFHTQKEGSPARWRRLSDITQSVRGEAWVCIHIHVPNLTFSFSPRATQRMKESGEGHSPFRFIQQMLLRPGHGGVQAAPACLKVKNMPRSPLQGRGAGNLVTDLVSGGLNNSTGTYILAQAFWTTNASLASPPRGCLSVQEMPVPVRPQARKPGVPTCGNCGLIFPGCPGLT